MWPTSQSEWAGEWRWIDSLDFSFLSCFARTFFLTLSRWTGCRILWRKQNQQRESRWRRLELEIKTRYLNCQCILPLHGKKPLGVYGSEGGRVTGRMSPRSPHVETNAFSFHSSSQKPISCFPPGSELIARPRKNVPSSSGSLCEAGNYFGGPLMHQRSAVSGIVQEGSSSRWLLDSNNSQRLLCTFNVHLWKNRSALFLSYQ